MEITPDAMFAYGMFNNDGYNTNEKFNMNYAGDKVRFVGATSNSLTEEGVLFTIVFLPCFISLFNNNLLIDRQNILNLLQRKNSYVIL